MQNKHRILLLLIIHLFPFSGPAAPLSFEHEYPSGEENDSTVIQRPATAFADSLFFSHFPEYLIDTMPAFEGTTVFSSDYQPSGSYWADQCVEKDVFLARLKHMTGDSMHWDLRLGKGGQKGQVEVAEKMNRV